jgi:GT2 family glycosyltransferase
VITQHLARQGLRDPRVRFDTSGFIRVGWEDDRTRLVSVVVPSRGADALLERCIDSLLARTAYPTVEIVVVNNGPRRPDDFDYYKRITRDSPVRVIHDERPFNYSAANNLGARHASRDLLVFLNNDTEVIASDWLDELVMWGARSSVGLVGAKLLFPDGRIQHAGVILGLTGFAGHVFAGAAESQESCFGWAEWYRNFLSVSAACILIRRNVFERVGGFDEEFSLCGSDVALGLRIHDLGYRVVYNPFARLRHHESATHQGRIPAQDFRVSLRHYRRWLEHGDPYFNPARHVWAPRVGFALDATGDGKTSLRGGFGLFHDQSLFHIFRSPAFRSLPYVNRGRLTSVTSLPVEASRFSGVELATESLQFELRPSYLMRYSLNLQREIAGSVLSLAYLGSRGVNLFGQGKMVNIAMFDAGLT